MASWYSMSAHRLGTCLNSSNGNIDYVLEQLAATPSIDPEVMRALESAREGSTRVQAIVRDLEIFSRPEVQAPGRVDVASVAGSAVSMA